jgi:hypothetical protein
MWVDHVKYAGLMKGELFFFLKQYCKYPIHQYTVNDVTDYPASGAISSFWQHVFPATGVCITQLLLRSTLEYHKQIFKALGEWDTYCGGITK